eukprot:g1576.t1
MKYFLFFIFVAVSCGTFANSSPLFSEDLLLQPLQDGSIAVHMHFSFDRSLPLNRHFELFPRPIGVIADDLGVAEMELTMTGPGRWLPKWGDPLPGAHPPPQGAHMWAWFFGDSERKIDSSVDSRWKALTGTLAGLFCGSLSGLSEKTATSEPKLSFRSTTKQYYDEQVKEKLQLRHASLPHENVCTENLAPWLKLLPCREHKGLGSLIVMKHIFSLPYFSMGIRLKQLKSTIHLKQKVVFVVPVEMAEQVDKMVHWTMDSIFATQSGFRPTKCPVATSSGAIMNSPFLSSEEEKGFQNLSSFWNSEEDGESKNFRLSFEIPKIDYDDSFLRSIHVQRHLTGHSASGGGITTTITNFQDWSIDTVLFESLPWYVRVYFHTIRVHINGQLVSDMEQRKNGRVIRPAEYQSSPCLLELPLTIPAKSSAVITVQYETAFLHMDEFPPDPSRGIDLPPASVMVLKGYGREKRKCSDKHLKAESLEAVALGCNSGPVMLYTESPLLYMPMPDFSMPYNVITLSSTVVALLFGSFFNIFSRKRKNKK